MSRQSFVKRATLGLVVAIVLMGCAAPTPAPQAASTFPTKTIEMAIGFPPGGMSDIGARALATTMVETLGQPVVVLNKSGAGGMEAGEYVTKAKPDGHTILLGSLPFYLPEQHRDEPAYKSTDLKAVAAVLATTPTIIVSSKAQWKTLKEFVDWAKTQPQVSIGHTGKGTSTHQTAAALGKIGGFKVVDVPFSGDATAATAVLGDNIQIAVVNFPALIQHLSAGTLRALAVVSDTPMDKAKDVPTMKAAGYDLPIPFPAIAIFAPAGTPDDVIAKLDEAIKKSLDHATTKAILSKSDIPIYYRDHVSFQKYLAEQKGPLGQMMFDLGIIKKAP